MRSNLRKDLTKQKVQVQEKLAVEKLLATMMTNLLTLCVRPAAPRKQVPEIVVKLLKNVWPRNI